MSSIQIHLSAVKTSCNQLIQRKYMVRNRIVKVGPQYMVLKVVILPFRLIISKNVIVAIYNVTDYFLGDNEAIVLCSIGFTGCCLSNE